MTRAVVLALLAILAGAAAVTGTACEQNHVDMYFGTDAGADFDAPAREVHADGGADDGADAAASDDAGTDDAPPAVD